MHQEFHEHGGWANSPFHDKLLTMAQARHCLNLTFFGGGLGIKKPRTKGVESVNFNGFREVELKFFGGSPFEHRYVFSRSAGLGLLFL